jgi:hypothetical protein
MSCQDCSDTCGCAVGAGDGSIAVTGNGSAATPYAVRTRLSGQPDNALSILGDGLYISSVTAMASGGTIVCTSSTRPAGSDGRRIFETDTDRTLVYNNSAWRGERAFSQPPNQFRGLYFDSPGDAATVPTVIDTAASLLTAPYPLRMVVRANGFGGYPAANRQGALLELLDSAGADLSPEWGAKCRVDAEAFEYGAFAMIGYKDYAAGAVCGFKLQYTATAGDERLWLRGGYEIEFIPT